MIMLNKMCNISQIYFQQSLKNYVLSSKCIVFFRKLKGNIVHHLNLSNILVVKFIYDIYIYIYTVLEGNEDILGKIFCQKLNKLNNKQYSSQ